MKKTGFKKPVVNRNQINFCTAEGVGKRSVSQVESADGIHFRRGERRVSRLLMFFSKADGIVVHTLI